ncbi:MAG: FG-GAP-like repeat-containing protein [Bdellovibrionota bacterium]
MKSNRKSRKAGKSKLRGWLVALAGVAGLSASVIAWSNQNQGIQHLGQVDSGSGSFQVSYPIEAPKFRGLEPKLGLAHSSGGGNGLVGVGFQFSGVSSIERASPGKGTPLYDSTDIFLMDGMELIDCGGTCATFGGTHRPKYENYTRIERDTTNNKWYVWQKNGLKMTYEPKIQFVDASTTYTYRWSLVTAEDTHGNSVTYTYSVESSLPSPYNIEEYESQSYLSQISYNGSTITLYWDVRSDYQISAIGGVSYTRDRFILTRKRLKSIDVKTGSSRIRVYALTYTNSGDSPLSRLTSAKAYGSDAAIDSGGAVTSGSVLPATDVTWNVPPTGSSAFGSEIEGAGIRPSGVNVAYGGRNIWPGDFNGDSKMDLMYHVSGSSPLEMRVMRATGSGFADDESFDNKTLAYVPADSGRKAWVGDIDADGKADFVYLATVSSQNQIRVIQTNSTADGFDSEEVWGSGTTISDSLKMTAAAANHYLVDVTCDGKADLVQQEKYYGGGKVTVYRSTGSGFELFQSQEPFDYEPSYSQNGIWLGDFNGDGCMDFVYNRHQTTYYYVMFGSEDGFLENDEYWESAPVPGSWGITTHRIGDVNGDGRSDLVYERHQTNEVWVMLSTGSGFETRQWGDHSTPGIAYSGNAMWVTDINGDGLSDFVYQGGGTHNFYVMLSNGTSFDSKSLWFTKTHNQGEDQGGGYGWFLDFTGNGKSDYVYNTEDGSNTPWLDRYYDLFKAQGNRHITLNTITNNRGVTTTVSYVPSSNWPSQEFPTFATSESGDSSIGGEGSVTRVVSTPLVFETVQKLSTTDTSTDPDLVFQTFYTYSGAKWSYEERRLLGFNITTQTITDDGDTSSTDEAFSKTDFRQDLPCAGQTDWSFVKTSGGAIYQAQNVEYNRLEGDSLGSPPYVCLQEIQHAYECELQTSSETSLTGCRETRQEVVSYDAFGNPLESRNHGDYSTTSDDTTQTVSLTLPGTTQTFIIAPHTKKLYEGLGTGGNLLQHTKIYYDGQTHTTLPTKGDVTKQEQQYNASGTTLTAGSDPWLTTTATYDSYGNKLSSTDVLSRTAWTVYDSTYNLFPIRSCNPKVTADNSITSVSGCTSGIADTTQDYDLFQSDSFAGPFGAVVFQKGWDGQMVKTDYDVFGRTIATYGPEMNTTPDPDVPWLVQEVSYNTASTPNTRTVKSYETGGGSSYLESIEFLNGFGKVIQKKQRAEDSQVVVSGTTVFDAYAGSDPGADDIYAVRTYNPFFQGNSSFSTYTGVSGLPSGLARSTTEYDDAGRQVKSIVPKKRNGSSTDYVNITTCYGYHATNCPDGGIGKVVVADPLGSKKITTKDALGRLTKIDEDVAASTVATTRYGYDVQGRLRRICDAEDSTTTCDDTEADAKMTYDSLGRQLTLWEPNQGTKTYTYNSDGTVATETDALSNVLRLTYDNLGRITRKCATKGGSANDVGLIKVKSSAPAAATAQGGCNSGEVEIAVYTYDNASATNSEGRLTKLADLSGTTEYEYSERGQIRKIKRRMDCDTNSSPNQDCAEFTVERWFDLLGRQTKIKYPDTEEVVYSYQTRGLLSKVENTVDPRVYAQNFVYDEAGNVTTVEYGNGVTTIRDYDPDSFRLAELDTGDYAFTPTDEDQRMAPAAILNSYNLSGAVTDIDEDPDSYDGSWLTAPSDNDDTYVRVSFGTPTYALKTGADLQECRTVVRQSNPGGLTPQAQMELWENGSLVRTGSATNVTSTSGQVLSLTWNATELSDPTGANVECAVYGARVSGNPSNRNSVEVGAIEWNAKTTHIVISGTTHQNYSYTYDDNGNISALNDLRSSAPDATFTYDKLNRLTVADETGTGSYGYRKFDYDKLGNITQRYFNSGLTDYETYSYSGADGGLWHGVGKIRDEGSNQIYAYTYDANGNMKTRNFGGNTYNLEYGYDNRLHTYKNGSTTTAQYVYDGHGGMAIKYYDSKVNYYVGPWFEVRDGKAVKHIFGLGRTAVVTYSASRSDFAVTASLGGAAQEGAKRFWRHLTNPRGDYPAYKVAVASLWGTCVILVLAIAFGWPLKLWRGLIGWMKSHRTRKEKKLDQQSEELSKRIWHETPAFGGRWGLVRTASLLFAAFLLASTTISCRGRVYDENGRFALDESAANSFSRTETVQYLHPDHLGSTNVVTDSSGAEVERNKYLPYGEVQTHTGSSNSDRTHAGKRYESESGLMFVENRFYDAVIGRWITSDPRQLAPQGLQALRQVEWDWENGNPSPGADIKDRVKQWQERAYAPQDLNRFSYSLNNPINQTDEDGYGFMKIFKKVLKGIAMALVAHILIAIAIIAAPILGPFITSGLFMGISGGLMSGLTALATGGNIWKAMATGFATGFIAGFGFQFLGQLAARFGLGELSYRLLSVPGNAALDVQSMSTGAIFGNIGGILSGTANMLAAPFSTGRVWSAFQEGFAQFANSLVPRYGGAAGPGMGPSPQNYDYFGVTYGTNMDQAAKVHDWTYYNNVFSVGDATRADMALLRGSWSGQVLGPYGQAYRAILSVGFGMKMAFENATNICMICKAAP